MSSGLVTAESLPLGRVATPPPPPALISLVPVAMGGPDVNDTVTPKLARAFVYLVADWPAGTTFKFSVTGYSQLGAANLVVELYDLTLGAVAVTVTIPTSAAPASANAVLVPLANHTYEARFYSSVAGVPAFLSSCSIEARHP